MLDLLYVLVHIAAGLAALTAGIVAMMSHKGAWWHRKAGVTYLIAIGTIAVTAAGLVATRGAEFQYLLIFAAVAVTLAFGGYFLRRISQSMHLSGMGLSYIAMVTAFYVDNGPKLPFWNRFPEAIFWVGPVTIGLPIIVRALWRRGRSRIA